VLKKFGDFSASARPVDYARAVRRGVAENNCAIVAANEKVLRLAPPKKRDIAEIVVKCERMLDVLIEPLVECRDVSVGAARYIHGPLLSRGKT
jgi:hypothetical protein